MISKVLEWLGLGVRHERSEEEILQSIRNGMEGVGYDMSDFSDDDIKEGVVRISNVCRESGVTIEEAVDGSRRIVEALEKQPGSRLSR